MKRYTGIYEQIYDFANLERAYKKARRCKRYRNEVLRYSRNLEENLINLQNHLIWHSYEQGIYRTFYVYEPKKRLISALPFADRVAQHAINNILEPLIDRRFYYHSYACRKEKGMHKASEVLTKWLYDETFDGKPLYAIKADIHHYFQSIDHERLKATIRRIIKDEEALALLDKIIDNVGTDGKGIPVGNLTSQLFANLYLDRMDKYLKETLHVRHYIKIRTRKGTKSMKKTMTRILTLALALAMSASVLAGCSDSPEPAASGSSTESTASEDAAGGERAKLTAMIVKWSPLTKDVNEMQWLKNVAEAANVEVEWQQESSDWNDKKNAVFSSGNIPDVLFSAAGDAEFTQYPGLFEDMGPLIDQYAPNVKEMFETYPEIEYACKDMEGKTYTLPRIDGTYEACKNYASMFINKTWLDNLGLEIPTTWDELEQVLIAFNEQDPNGNGDPNDEIPMDFIWNDNTNNQYGPANMLGGTGMPLSNGYIQGFFAEDGEVKCWYTDERFQSLLIYLQGLWNQGLINEAAFTNDYSQYQALARGEGTTAKVGFTFGWNLTDRFGNELADQYVVLPPLKADDSLPDDQLYYVSEDTFWGKGVVSMSASCENKEAAMRFINQFYDYDVSLEVMYGGMNDVDNCIVKNDDGTYEVLPPKDSSMDPSSWQWTNTFVNNGGMWVRNDVQVKTPVPDLTLGEKETYLPYQESIPTNSLFKNDLMKYSQEDQNTLAMVETNLGNIWDPQVANWITGTNDIATEWEAYVDSLKNAGLDQALEIKQAAFDTYLEATGN